MENQNLKITSLEDLKRYSTDGTIIQLPDFGEGQPFVAKLKRPSMLNLVRLGKIPNELLESANSLFEGGAQAALAAKTSKGDNESMSRLFDIIDVICEEAFVEPTYKELKEAGVQLTDEQYLAVFEYSQVGVKQLNSFR